MWEALYQAALDKGWFWKGRLQSKQPKLTLLTAGSCDSSAKAESGVVPIVSWNLGSLEWKQGKGHF